MTTKTIRESWEDFWRDADAAAQAAKFSEAAYFELSKEYMRLTPEARTVVDAVLAEWLLSDNGTKRFDALGLIEEHRISSALPALRVLAARLSSAGDPPTRNELERVEQVIGTLAC